MANQRVLVVDDEPGIRQVLRAYLERDSFDVTEGADGEEALRLAQGAEAPDLVLLDVGLPGVDGLEVLTRIRAVSADLPVILVTARVEEVDRLVGLGLGADDYISKPFSPREVVARVKTVLRRASRMAAAAPGDDRTSEALAFGDLLVDPARREVRRGDQPVELTALEFDLLWMLVSSPGRVFTRRQILERVWGGDWFGDERVVDVHIRALRQRLGDDASAPTYIGTARGVGYRFLQDRT